jgi:hypothetical protein
MDEMEIWRMAAQLIKQQGEGAELSALQRGDKALDRGDLDGFNLWKRVARAVTEIARPKPSAGELVH